jgi:hypothetical protein
MARSSSIFVPIVGEDKLSKKLASVQSKVAKFGRGISNVGKKLTTHVTLPLGVAGVASVKLAKDFNESMANVATLIPGQRDRINELHDSVLELSVKMGKSTKDLSEGLYQTISAFGDKVEGDVDVTMRNLEIAAKAGVAGRATTVESLKLLSAVTKAYGEDSAEATQQVADLAMLTVKLGETTYPELAASMGKIVSTAATLNVSQKELFGTMATFTGTLGSTSEVATKVSAVLAAFIKPSAKMTKGLKSLGFESSIAAVKQLGLRKAVMATEVVTAKKSDRAKVLKEMGFASIKAAEKSLGLAKTVEVLSEKLETNEAAMGKVFGRKEALDFVFAALGDQAESYGDKLAQVSEETKNLGQVSGAAYAEQTQGINKFGHSWDKFQSKMKATGIKLGEKLLPVVEKLLTALEPLLDKILAADPATLEWGLRIGGLAMAIGPALRVVGGFTQGLSGLMGLVSKSKTGMSALTRIFGKLGGAGDGLDGVTDGLSGVGTAAGGATGQVSKLTSALGKAGAVAGALGAGLAIGEGLNQLLFDPQVEETTKERDTLENLRRKAMETVRHGTREEKLAAHEALGKAAIEGPGAVSNIEDVFGTLASLVSDVESPMERYERQTEEIIETQKALIASLKDEKAIRRFNTQAQAEVIETRSMTKEVVEVTFANAPKGTRVRRSQRGKPAVDTGVSMAGAL